MSAVSESDCVRDGGMEPPGSAYAPVTSTTGNAFGFTLVEVLAVIAILVALAAILLPTLVRSREAARRVSCQSNLRQVFLAVRMYATESEGGYYPPTQKWHLNGTPTALWLRGEELYPEYLSDPNISLCPSDSRAREFVGGLALDFGGYIQDVIDNGATEVCVEALLSLGVSYTYLGYLTRSSSQVKDIAMSRVAIASMESINGNAVFVEALDMEEQGCPRRMFAAYGSIGLHDIPGDPAVQAGYGKIDDDGSVMPEGYYRLRTGIERFVAEDINDAAATSIAESQVPIIYDTWAAEVPAFGGSARFNHIPGGANVLYMDGHVEFVRLHSRFPVSNSPKGTYGEDLANVMAFVSGSD